MKLLSYTGGDLKADFNAIEHASVLMNTFRSDNNLYCCESVNSNGIESNYTYSSAALGYYSIIDYFITSDSSALACFNVIEPSVNLFYHRPIIVHFSNKKPIANRTKQWHNAKDKTAVNSAAPKSRWSVIILSLNRFACAEIIAGFWSSSWQDKFGLSYIIPLLKGNTASMSKSLAASDFREYQLVLSFRKYLKIVFFKDINIF